MSKLRKNIVKVAEFLGGTPYDPALGGDHWQFTTEMWNKLFPGEVNDDDLSIRHWAFMRFDRDWHLLMAVVETIEKLGFDFELQSRNGTVMRQNNPKVSVVSISKAFSTVGEISDRLHKVVPSETVIVYYDKPGDKLQAIFEAVLNFIDLYNKTRTDDQGR